MSKLLTVFGATGRQGGSVIRTILSDSTLSSQFKLRGITRDVTKPDAKALADKGVEVISADMTSVPSLVQAVKDSHSVFLVTTPTYTENSNLELTQGKNVADAAKQAGVQHLIFSSLLNVTEASGGRLKDVPHFDHKAQVEQYIRSLGLKSTFVLPGYFMSNYTSLGMIRKSEDGVFTLAYPVGEGAQFPLVDIDADMGKYVSIALKNPSKTTGSQILAAADYYTSTRILKEFEEVTGHKTRFVQVDNETYKGFMPGYLGLEMLENHLFVEDPGYYNGRSLKESQDLLKDAGFKPTTWKDFLEKNKGAFA
ncbi:NmrA/HSCARG family protein [Aspergillus undulatus]|uniref:NmrA/HSCARG family protein n=1 Tax=Aspergillus undulatus TaxID=1810928 RepID=UPI003CCE4A03